VFALRGLGLEIGQGPLYSPPVNADACEELLAKSWQHSARLSRDESSTVAARRK
jgi:hypothetical protein